ncbi:MAG: MarR family winged helix-turn-helix transcriptional regulator, partial [Pseudomonadota bacterium]
KSLGSLWAIAQSEPKDFMTYSLSRLQAKLNAQASAVLRSCSSLSLVQWRILLVLRVMEADSLTTICRVSDMDKGQVSRKLNKLIDDGLVVSKPDQSDHRTHRLSLSDAGHRLYERILPLMQKRQDHLLGTLTPEEQTHLRSMLGRLMDAAERRDF